MKNRTLRLMIPILLILSTVAMAGAFLEPQPGDIFREHILAPKKWIRVGGKQDQGKTLRTFPGNVDLAGATKAMVRIQKLLCHEGTKGLAIMINNKLPLVFPESKLIPAPATDYQYMVYPTVEVPLSYLKAGSNSFTMKVDPKQYWGWPQNVIYGVTLMVFYGQSKPHPTGSVTSPAKGAALGQSARLAVEVKANGSPIASVDYFGHYEDFNYEGDGEYKQWHYHRLGEKMMRNLGSTSRPPYSTAWNTFWVPDQDEPIKIAARIKDQSGMVYITEAVEGITLNRPGTAVKMYKPFNVPKFWVTRKKKYQENITIPTTHNLKTASSARLVWVSWSACYAAGVSVNGTKVCDKPSPAPCYGYAFHNLSFKSSLLKNGTNVIGTGLSPLGPDGKKDHGMEVNWPGIVVMVRYKTSTGNRQSSPVPSSTAKGLRLSQASGNGIHVTIDDARKFQLAFVDVMGRTMKTISGQGPVSHTYSFQPRCLGVYFARLKVNASTGHSTGGEERAVVRRMAVF